MDNKKGLSEIVAYVLLVVVAIGISVLVYAWIQSYLPKETVNCPEDTSLIIKDYSCDSTKDEINITFQNKGLFDIDGTLIKASSETGVNPTYNLNLTENKERSGVINFKNHTSLNEDLHPGESLSLTFSYGKYGQIFKIQLIPMMRLPDSQSNLLCGDSSQIFDVNGCL